ncbi:MAG: BrnT family toxin [Chloroflexota bacterium]
MKRFDWNDDKNKLLIAERNICFEDIIIAMEQGFLLDILDHPNKDKYTNQKIFIVQIDHYVFMVPFVEDDQEIFLKTIIPSRKATRQYKK